MLTQISNRLPILFKSAIDRKLDATELLTREHMKVERLFLQIRLLGQVIRRMPSRLDSRRSDAVSRRQLMFAELKQSLEKHMRAEETVFYPQIREIAGLEGKVDHSFDEHKEAKTILNTLDSLPIDGQEFDTQLARLMQAIMHHVNEEEETIFPKVRKAFTKTRLEKLGAEVRMAEMTKPKKARKTKKKSDGSPSVSDTAA